MDVGGKEINMSYSQWHKSNGDVMLSRWWRTPSARAAFRRVKLERAKRFRALKQAKAKERQITCKITNITG